jgi:hypothetical protein
LVCLTLIFDQFAGITAEVDVGQDALRLEGHTVMEHAHISGLELFGEVGHVIRKTQEVLLVGIPADLAGHFQLRGLIFDRAAAFDGQHIGIGNAVVEHNAPIDFEVVRGFGDVIACGLGIINTASKARKGSKHGDSNKDLFHVYFSLFFYVTFSSC